MNKEYKNIDAVKTGKFIRELRESHNWTQEHLGEKIFISRKSVSKWETGRCCPSIDMLKRLSEALGVTFDDLIAGEFVNPPVDGNEIAKKVEVKKSRSFFIGVLIILLVVISVLLSRRNGLSTTLSINYEDENFSIYNGVLSLGERSSINFGRFKTNFDMANLSKLHFKLYVSTDDEEIEVLAFDEIDNTYPIISNSKNILEKIAINNETDKLYLKIYYFNDYEEEVSYDLHLKVGAVDNSFAERFMIKKPSLLSFSKQSRNNFDFIKKQEASVDLSFLFNMSSEKIMNCIDGKSMYIDGESYHISYTYNLDKEDNFLTIFNDRSEIVYFLDQSRINISKPKAMHFYVRKNSIINSYDAGDYYDFIKEVSLGLDTYCKDV